MVGGFVSSGLVLWFDFCLLWAGFSSFWCFIFCFLFVNFDCFDLRAGMWVGFWWVHVSGVFSGLLWVDHFGFRYSGLICLFRLVFGCLFVLSLVLGVFGLCLTRVGTFGFVIKQRLWSLGILVGLLFRWFFGLELLV